MNIMLNGINYSYLEVGEGQTILLLHGFTGSKETWTNLINRLKQNFHVIAIDLLGHGETESPNHEERYMMEPAAKDLYDFLTKKQIEVSSFAWLFNGWTDSAIVTQLIIMHVKRC